MYQYRSERPALFTEEGVVDFLHVRDRTAKLLNEAGAARMQEILSGISFIGSGTNWYHMACVDRLVELKEIREITDEDTSGQHRVFVRRDK